jgi:hypothetical protein
MIYSIAECGGTLRNDMAKIDVPEFTSYNPTTCVWHIISVGNLLSYNFGALDIQSDNENCTTDYVEVKEVFSSGASGNEKVLRSQNHQRYCGTKFNRTAITTASDQLIVTLNSTRGIGKGSHKYFKMNFNSFQPGKLDSFF